MKGNRDGRGGLLRKGRGGVSGTVDQLGDRGEGKGAGGRD